MAHVRLIRECVRNPLMWPAAATYYLKRKYKIAPINLRRQGITMQVGLQEGEGAWQGISGLDYEPELRQILALVKRGDIILDVGANIGSYTLRFALKTGEKGRVVAFEANPNTAKVLQNNIRLNRLKNIIVLAKALGDRNAAVDLYSNGHSSSSSLLPDPSFDRSAPTEMVTGDSIANELGLPRVDWIKLDIEGAEPGAIRGLDETLKRFRPRILFEDGAAGDETSALLQSMGYVVGTLEGGGRLNPRGERRPIGNLFAFPREAI